MAHIPLPPWTSSVQLDESSQLRNHRYADRFSIVRVETTGPLAEAVQKSSSVPALLLSTFLKTVAPSNYRLWFDGKLVPVGKLPAFCVNVVDLAGGPAIWGGPGVDCVHFHIRQGTLDDTAAAFGYERVGKFRLSIAQEDIALAQVTRSVMPFLAPRAAPSPLALEQLELIVAAHVVQRYSGAKQRHQQLSSQLAPWQSQRAAEFLRENLDGKVGLADVARVCELSVSHFARSFKATFGVSCHRWLTERRVEQAQALLVNSAAPLVEIASQAGFADQPALTRTFQRFVGITPAKWRREHKGR